MDIASIGSPGLDVFSPVQGPRDERTEAPANEPERDPAPLPPTSGTVVDTTA